jgi:hypothetical protein
MATKIGLVSAIETSVMKILEALATLLGLASREHPCQKQKLLYWQT